MISKTEPAFEEVSGETDTRKASIDCLNKRGMQPAGCEFGMFGKCYLLEESTDLHGSTKKGQAGHRVRNEKQRKRHLS